jgi:hypothetical protein
VLSSIKDAVVSFVNGVKSVWNTTWGAIRDFFVGIWDAMWKVLEPWVKMWTLIIGNALRLIWAIWRLYLALVLLFYKVVWKAITLVTRAAMWAIKAIIGAVLWAIKALWSLIWNTIKFIVLGVWKIISSAVKAYINGVKATIVAVLTAIKIFWTAVWNAIKGVVLPIWEGIKTAVGAAIDWVSSKISSVLNGIKVVWDSIWGGIKSVLSGIWDGIKTTVGAAVDWVLDKIGKLLGPVKTLINGVKAAGRGIGNFVGGAADAVGGAADWVGGINLNRGGLVPGVGSKDTVPALLTPGEFVLTKQTVAAIGAAELRRINDQNGGLDTLVPNAKLVRLMKDDAGGGGKAPAKPAAKPAPKPAAKPSDNKANAPAGSVGSLATTNSLLRVANGNLHWIHHRANQLVASVGTSVGQLKAINANVKAMRRTMSDMALNAAIAGVGGGATLVRNQTLTLNVYNPAREATSRSLHREMQKLAFHGILGSD